MNLKAVFEEINSRHFDDFLESPVLRWNTRLRTSAGRFIPGSRKFWREAPPIIEVASYLLEEDKAIAFIHDTIAHEMIHYWLWVRKRPFGHNAEFLMKMNQMGVSRYNPVPRSRPFRYVYKCAHCAAEFFAKRRLGALACAKCCKLHNDGRYDHQFRLVFDRHFTPSKTPVLSPQMEG